MEIVVDKWNRNEDGLSSWAVGYGWAMRILSLSLEVVLLILAGNWLDQYLGTRPILLLTGTFLGLAVFFVSLLGWANPGKKKTGDPPDPGRP